MQANYGIRVMEENTMGNNTYHRNSSIQWRVLRPFITLLLGILALSSCQTETIFPKKPESHRLLIELEKWPNEYYWLVESGVSSRVMGIRAEGDGIGEALRRVDELLGQVKEQWSSIGTLDTPGKLINYFRAHDLAPIAEAIEKTLSQNRAREPTDELHSQLQAMAIKRGLTYAYNEVRKELSR